MKVCGICSSIKFSLVIFLVVAPAFLLAQSPKFTSTPVVEATVGEHYQYNITTKGWWFVSREIVLTDGKLPKGLELKDNGDGTGVLSGRPEETGSFFIQLTVRLKSGDNKDDDDDEDRSTDSSDKQEFTLVVSKPEAKIIFSNMTTTYNGNAQEPTIKTDPEGLKLKVTYDGSSAPPINAGKYGVHAIVEDKDYEGSAEGTFVIDKAAAEVDLGNLTTTYNGNPTEPSVTTSPAGLTVEITYNGSSKPPVNAGKYTVEALIDELNYSGSARATMEIRKREASITLSNLTAVYDGKPKAVTVETSPPGLDVIVTYDGSKTAPSAVGSYEVKAVVDDQNHKGSTWSQLVIKAKDENNSRPVVSNIESSPLVYIENTAGVSISRTLKITDANDSELAEATIIISGNYVKGQDNLLYKNLHGISGEFNEDEGVLKLSGTSTPSNYEEAISNVLYKSSGGQTDNSGKYITIMVSDGKHYSESVSRQIVVIKEGEEIAGRPVISNLEQDPLTYFQGDPGMAVSETLIINDLDNTHMMGATIKITKNYAPGTDVLLYNNQSTPNISALFHEESGILELSGEETRSNYETAFRNVLYRNNALDEQTDLEKEISLAVTDGTFYSEFVTREIAILLFPELDIVNAFTPNGDNINDSWNFIDLDAYSAIAIDVFNKDGKKVFSCHEYDCEWDGRYKGELLPADVYFYAIDLNHGRRKYRGTVTLLR